jgi:HSP20 family protein
MAVVRWDPFSNMVSLSRELERIWPFEKNEVVSWAPRTDIKETDKNILVKVDIPGMKMEDINVSVDNDILNISGEKD